MTAELIFPERQLKIAQDREAFLQKVIASGSIQDEFREHEIIGEGGTRGIIRVTEEDGRRIVLGVEYPYELLSEKHQRDYTTHRSVTDRLTRLLADSDVSFHPRIPTVLGTGKTEVDGAEITFLKEDYFEGWTVRELRHANPGFPDDLEERIISCVSSVLIPLHEDMGMAHLDITPDNVLVGRNLDVKIRRFTARVIDFGIATRFSERASETSLSAREIVAPEVYRQLEREGAYTITPSLDVYALGNLLCYIRTGDHAFDSPQGVKRNAAQVSLAKRKLAATDLRGLRRRKSRDARMTSQMSHAWQEHRTSIPPELGELILQALDNKKLRHTSLREFRDEYLAVMGGGETKSTRKSMRPFRVVGATVGLGLAVGMLYLSVFETTGRHWLDMAKERVQHRELISKSWSSMLDGDGWKPFEEWQPELTSRRIPVGDDSGQAIAQLEKSMGTEHGYEVPMTLGSILLERDPEEYMPGDTRRAFLLLKEARALYNDTLLTDRSRDDEVWILRTMGRVLLDNGKPRPARFYVEKAIREHEVGTRVPDASLYDLLSNIYRRCDRGRQAIKADEKAASIIRGL